MVYHGVVLLTRTLYCHTGNIHTTRVNLILAVVGVEHIVQFASLVVERCAVTYAYQPFRELENWIFGQFAPRTSYVVRYGTTNAVVVALVTIARIEHKVQTTVFDDARALVYFALDLLPALFWLYAVGYRVRLYGYEILLQLRSLYVKPIFDVDIK